MSRPLLAWIAGVVVLAVVLCGLAAGPAAAAEGAGAGDGGGWTTIPPPGPRCVVGYASTVHGSDMNDGRSPTTAKRTIAQVGRVNRIMLERGSVFDGVSMSNWDLWGASADDPFVVGAYGSGERPIIKPAAGANGILVNAPVGATKGHLRIVDLHLVGRGDGVGIGIGRGMSDCLIEGCLVEGFGVNVQLGPADHGEARCSDLTVNRSVMADACGAGDAHGTMAAGVDGVRYTGCLFVHNGFWPDGHVGGPPDRSHGAYGTYGYYQGDAVSLCTGVEYSNCAAIGNVCTGIGARGGGTLDGILAVDNVYAIGFGHDQNWPPDTARGSNTGSIRNVLVDGSHNVQGGAPLGVGISFSWVRSVTVDRVLIQNTGSTGSMYAMLFAYRCEGVSLGRVVVHNWYDVAAPNGVRWTAAGANPIAAGAVTAVKAGDAVPTGWTDPTRSFDSYARTLGLDRAGLIAAMRAQDSRNWRAELEPRTIIDWTLAGHGL